jgi:hypothetical protein
VRVGRKESVRLAPARPGDNGAPSLDAGGFPTNATVTNVPATEFGLSWTDKAGQDAQGSKVLRAVNRGRFTA